MIIILKTHPVLAKLVHNLLNILHIFNSGELALGANPSSRP